MRFFRSVADSGASRRDKPDPPKLLKPAHRSGVLDSLNTRANIQRRRPRLAYEDPARRAYACYSLLPPVSAEPSSFSSMRASSITLARAATREEKASQSVRVPCESLLCRFPGSASFAAVAVIATLAHSTSGAQLVKLEKTGAVARSSRTTIRRQSVLCVYCC